MHHEALNKQGKKIFPKLKFFKDFYLAGGTSLALQIGHRVSLDFDFFSGRYIPKSLLADIKKIFVGQEITASVNNPEELTIFAGNTKITFVYYPFPLVDSLVDIDGVLALGIKEISATKAYAIGRRGSFKDYIDIFYIISENYATLEEIINLAGKKFGHEFNARLFLEQLIYLEDVKDEKIVFLKASIDKMMLKEFFEAKIKKIKL